MDLNKVKLLSKEEIDEPVKFKKTIKAKISPSSIIYFFEEKEQGGFAEKVNNKDQIYYGYMDKEMQGGLEIVRGVLTGDLIQGYEDAMLNVRDPITRTITSLQVCKNGESFSLKLKINGQRYKESFIRLKNGDLFFFGDNYGYPAVEDGEEKRYIYTFYEFAQDKTHQKFYPYGNTVMYQSDYPYIEYQEDKIPYYDMDITKPYYVYTADNKKYLIRPNEKPELVASGASVKKIISKVRDVVYKELAFYGLDNYDKETHTYKKKEVQEKKGILSRIIKKEDREA